MSLGIPQEPTPISSDKIISQPQEKKVAEEVSDAGAINKEALAISDDKNEIKEIKLELPKESVISKISRQIQEEESEIEMSSKKDVDEADAKRDSEKEQVIRYAKPGMEGEVRHFMDKMDSWDASYDNLEKRFEEATNSSMIFNKAERAILDKMESDGATPKQINTMKALLPKLNENSRREAVEKIKDHLFLGREAADIEKALKGEKNKRGESYLKPPVDNLVNTRVDNANRKKAEAQVNSVLKSFEDIKPLKNESKPASATEMPVKEEVEVKGQAEIMSKEEAEFHKQNESIIARAKPGSEEEVRELLNGFTFLPMQERMDQAEARGLLVEDAGAGMMKEEVSEKLSEEQNQILEAILPNIKDDMKESAKETIKELLQQGLGSTQVDIEEILRRQGEATKNSYFK